MSKAFKHPHLFGCGEVGGPSDCQLVENLRCVSSACDRAWIKPGPDQDVVLRFAHFLMVPFHRRFISEQFFVIESVGHLNRVISLRRSLFDRIKRFKQLLEALGFDIFGGLKHLVTGFDCGLDAWHIIRRLCN